MYSRFKWSRVADIFWIMLAFAIPEGFAYEISRDVPVMIWAEKATCYYPRSTAHKQYVVSHLAPRVDTLIAYVPTDHYNPVSATVNDVQEWIDIAHQYGMRIGLMASSVPNQGNIPHAVGPANLYAPNHSTIRPSDGTLGTLGAIDYGNTTAVNMAAQNLKQFVSQIRGLDYFVFDETGLPRTSWPSPFSDWCAEPPYFAFGTYSDEALADFRTYLVNPMAKFPVKAEDSVFVDEHPEKFAVITDETYWNKWWGWRFNITRRYIETNAEAVHEAMDSQDNRYFKGVMYINHNRWLYDSTYNIHGTHRKAYGTAIGDVDLPYVPEEVPGLASAPNIDIVVGADGGDQRILGASDTVRLVKAAAEEYDKDWGNFLSLWQYGTPGAHNTIERLNEALSMTTQYESRIVTAYEDGVLYPNGEYNVFDNYSEEITDWWDQHIEPRAQIPLVVTGDATGNGVVDLMDLLYVRDHFGLEEPDPDYNAYADLNNDGIIDLFDLLVVRNNFGLTVDDLISQGEATAIPEPVSVFLWIMVTMLAIKHRTRKPFYRFLQRRRFGNDGPDRYGKWRHFCRAGLFRWDLLYAETFIRLISPSWRRLPYALSIDTSVD